MIDFSIIIPAYNSLVLMQRALNSVISQKMISFELIVVDDSDNNDIEYFITKLEDPRIKYHHNIPRLGAVKNWNFGLSKALGEYVILLHHDEYIVDRQYYLYNCYTHLKKKKCDIVISKIVVYYSNGTSYEKKLPTTMLQLILNKMPSILYIFNPIGPTSCVAFKRNLLAQFDEKLNWYVDVDWYYQMFSGNDVIIGKNLEIASTYGHENQISKNIDFKIARIKDQKIIRNRTNLNSIVILALICGNLLLKLKKLITKT